MGYTDLEHIRMLASKYKIDPCLAGYLYGMIQNKISMVSFGYLLKELSVIFEAANLHEFSQQFSLFVNKVIVISKKQERL